MLMIGRRRRSSLCCCRARRYISSMLTRRSAIVGALFAPAIIRTAGLIMPISRSALPAETFGAWYPSGMDDPYRRPREDASFWVVPFRTVPGWRTVYLSKLTA
jgi:hypothetical protein